MNELLKYNLIPKYKLVEIFRNFFIYVILFRKQNIHKVSNNFDLLKKLRLF